MAGSRDKAGEGLLRGLREWFLQVWLEGRYGPMGGGPGTVRGKGMGREGLGHLCFLFLHLGPSLSLQPYLALFLGPHLARSSLGPLPIRMEIAPVPLSGELSGVCKSFLWAHPLSQQHFEVVIVITCQGMPYSRLRGRKQVQRSQRRWQRGAGTQMF